MIWDTTPALAEGCVGGWVVGWEGKKVSEGGIIYLSCYSAEMKCSVFFLFFSQNFVDIALYVLLK